MRNIVKMSVLSTAVLFALPAMANWTPMQVEDIAKDGSREIVEFNALEAAQEPWDICVSFPHLKDSFWLAANYGVTEHAKKLNVNLQVMDAGGYTQLNNQISQIENCVAGGAKAVVIGAIAQDGLSNLITDLKNKDIKVVDVYNGINSEKVDARVLSSPRDEGLRAGQYLAAKYPAGSDPVRVVWLPGPAGAGWVELFNNGFLEGIEGSSVEIIETKYGDTGKEVQSRLIEDLIQTHKDIDYIVGNAVTSEAAVPILRARRISDKIKVLSVYTTPGVYQGVKTGNIEAAGMAPIVNIGRIGIDQAVRLLEGKEIIENIGLLGSVYTQEDVSLLDIDGTLAPNSFRPVFRVEAK